MAKPPNLFVSSTFTFPPVWLPVLQSQLRRSWMVKRIHRHSARDQIKQLRLFLLHQFDHCFPSMMQRRLEILAFRLGSAGSVLSVFLSHLPEKKFPTCFGFPPRCIPFRFLISWCNLWPSGDDRACSRRSDRLDHRESSFTTPTSAIE